MIQGHLPDRFDAPPGLRLYICRLVPRRHLHAGSDVHFGGVRDGIMGLSRAGCVVAQEWQKTPAIRSYVRLDAWMVMPNHVHGIIGITAESPAQPSVEASRRDASTLVNTANPSRLKAHSLGAIIGQFKSVCTKRIRRAGLLPDFAWQPRFYDRVIREARALQATRSYVLDNPLSWHRDPHHSRGAYGQ